MIEYHYRNVMGGSLRGLCLQAPLFFMKEIVRKRYRK